MFFKDIIFIKKLFFSFFVLNKSNAIGFVTFFLFNYIINYVEKRKIKLPNAFSNVIDFNYFSITQNALRISGFNLKLK